MKSRRWQHGELQRLLTEGTLRRGSFLSVSKIDCGILIGATVRNRPEVDVFFKYTHQTLVQLIPVPIVFRIGVYVHEKSGLPERSVAEIVEKSST